MFFVSGYLWTAPKSDYVSDQLLTDFPNGFSTFTYCDGGVFQNEPLGMAKNLVDEIDIHQNEDDRYYFFISPHSVGGNEISHAKYNAATADLRQNTSHLLTAIYGNASFQDWIEARDTNRHIALLDLRASELAKLLHQKKLNLLPADVVVTTVLDRMLSAEDQRKYLLQIRKQYKEELGMIVDPAQIDAYVRVLLLLQQAAQLVEKDKMQILDITAGPTDLAGSGIHSFLGFCFDKMREHDYEVGRKKAQDFIASNAIDLNRNYTSPSGRADPRSMPTVDEIPEWTRQALLDRLEDRIDLFLQEFDVEFLIRLVAKPWIVWKLGLKSELHL